MTRVGLGYDIHRLVQGRRLVLAGVELEHDKGLLGHSDADVVLHAVADALLGAAGKDDIGTLFPDTDPAHKDMASTVLLDRVKEVVFDKGGFSLENASIVIVAEEPKIAPHRQILRASLAKLLGVPCECINISAKTAEGLGSIGAGEAIAVTCAVLLNKESR